MHTCAYHWLYDRSDCWLL